MADEKVLEEIKTKVSELNELAKKAGVGLQVFCPTEKGIEFKDVLELKVRVVKDL